MLMKRKTIKFTTGMLLVPAMLISLMISCTNHREEKTLLFFYLETCPSCDEYILAEELSQALARMDREMAWNTGSYNLAIPENLQVLKETLKKMDLPDISRSLPLLIMDGNYINGYQDIEKEILQLSAENQK